MSNRIIFSVLFIFLLFCCKKNTTSSNNEVEAEWVSGPTVSYTYSFGAPNGGNWSSYYRVTDGDGDITFKVKGGTSDTKSETFMVEEGVTYKVKFSFGMANCSNQISAKELKITSTSIDGNRGVSANCNTLSVWDIYNYEDD